MNRLLQTGTGLSLFWAMSTPLKAQSSAIGASPGTEAGKIVASMTQAGVAIGTLTLVIAGYLLWAGHGNRLALAMWFVGLATLLSAPWLAGQIAPSTPG